MIYNGRQPSLRHKRTQFLDNGLTIEGDFSEEGQSKFRTWSELESWKEKTLFLFQQLYCIFFICCALYIFLIGLELMHRGFTVMGAPKIVEMINFAPTAIPALMIGIFIGALFQSTAITRSFVISFMASGHMTLENAVFVMMGANVGNTVTNHLVALLYLFPKKKFQRAGPASSLHFFFTLFTFVIMLPIEAGCRFLIITADKILAHLKDRRHSKTWESPIDFVTKQVTDHVCVVDLNHIEARSQGQPPGGSWISDGFFSHPHWKVQGGAGFLLVVIAFVLFAFSFVSWRYLFRQFGGRVERKTAGKVKKIFYPSVCGLFALIFAFVIQHSTIVTSIFIPAVAAEVINFEHYYALSVGANIGAAASAFVLALAQTNNDLLRLTLVELLFNLFSATIWYPLSWVRHIPVYLASRLGNEISINRWIFIAYMLFVFYFYPWVIYKLSRVNDPTLIGAGVGITVFFLLLFFYLWTFRYRWWWLPKRLQPTNALRDKISSFGPQTEQTTDEDLEYPGMGAQAVDATIQVDIASAENFTNLGIKVGEWNLLPTTTDGTEKPISNDAPRRPSISVGGDESQTDGFPGRNRAETGIRKPSDADGDAFVTSTSTTSTLTSSSAALSNKSSSRWAESKISTSGSTPSSYPTRPNSVSSQRISHELAPEFWANRVSTAPIGSENEEKVRLHTGFNEEERVRVHTGGVTDSFLLPKPLKREDTQPIGAVEETGASDIPPPPPL